ncbi:hypothetical protein CYMTET_5560 [Cymbomonas tetramitiformis]|uniref:Photosynthesis system II assembly factor Ycf48/Hcf136-like domain-containing protein n=1 Tax=Cymbomonas tetramitiformis TaxID=36881 RepID=A0AAE0GYW2_9CHLO|nr:hypothetical protein CYMTET_5560 [Cymbomonas tetramitiformis]
MSIRLSAVWLLVVAMHVTIPSVRCQEFFSGVGTDWRSGWLPEPFPLENRHGNDFDIRDCVFMSESVGYVVGTYDTVFKTENADDIDNVVWTELNTRKTVRNHWFSVSFLDTERGWIAGAYATIMKTSNGGMTWEHPYNLPSDTEPSIRIFTVQALEDADGKVTVFAGGSDGLVFRSYDEGESFSRLNTRVTETLRSVFFFNASVGWGVGDDGRSIHTHDGGNLWLGFRPEDQVVSTALQTVHGISVLEAWAAGDNGVLLHTTNGGYNWTVEESCTEKDIFDILVHEGRREGWTVGFEGVICHSADLGRSWYQQVGSIGENILTINQYDDIHPFTFGEAISMWMYIAEYQPGVVERVETIYLIDTRISGGDATKGSLDGFISTSAIGEHWRNWYVDGAEIERTWAALPNDANGNYHWAHLHLVYDRPFTDDINFFSRSLSGAEERPEGCTAGFLSEVYLWGVYLSQTDVYYISLGFDQKTPEGALLAYYPIEEGHGVFVDDLLNLERRSGELFNGPEWQLTAPIRAGWHWNYSIISPPPPLPRALLQPSPTTSWPSTAPASSPSSRSHHLRRPPTPAPPPRPPFPPPGLPSPPPSPLPPPPSPPHLPPPHPSSSLPTSEAGPPPLFQGLRHLQAHLPCPSPPPPPPRPPPPSPPPYSTPVSASDDSGSDEVDSTVIIAVAVICSLTGVAGLGMGLLYYRDVKRKQNYTLPQMDSAFESRKPLHEQEVLEAQDSLTMKDFNSPASSNKIAPAPSSPEYT